MNDRFKFRAWDKQLKQYIDSTHFGRFGIAIEFTFNPETNEFWCEYDKERYVLEQCTGLKDKKGKLIYEGDILEIDGYFNTASDNVVVYDEAISGFMPICSLDRDYSDYEVIGNIHEKDKENGKH